VVAAEAHLADGRPGAALDLLRGSLSPGAHGLCFHVSRAAAHLSLGQPSLALDETQECIQPSLRHAVGSLTKVHILRAAAHLELRHPAAARAELSRAVHLTPVEWRAVTFGVLPPSSLGGLRDLIAESDPEDGLLGIFDAMAARIPESRQRQFADALTRKETQLLSLLRDGSSLAEIAGRMFVSINTVKSQSRSLYRKLGVTSRREAVDLAYAMAVSIAPDWDDDADVGGLRRSGT